MQKPSSSSKQNPLENGTGIQQSQNGRDLFILQSMLRKLAITLLTRERGDMSQLPLHYSFEERRKRAHRILIYRPAELQAASQLFFVGFVSNKRQDLEQHVIDELARVDTLMLDQIGQIPGLLSYSSLELRRGNWYNLVVLQEANVKAHFGALALHRYASYELSPSYYEWIRLHNGSLPGGLAQQKLLLSSTRYYFFHA